jgi:hypothetical protein
MIGESFFARLVRIGGGDSRAVLMLHDALATNYRRLRDRDLEKVGLDRGTVQLLLGLALVVFSLGVAVLVWFLRDRVDLAAAALVTVQAAMIVFLCVLDMINGLLGDEVWRAVASWPLSSKTFLYARMIQPTQRALLISSVVVTPSIAVMMIFHGIPFVTGLVMIPVCTVVALSVIWSAAAALTMGMGLFRIETVRASLPVLIFSLTVLPILVFRRLPTEAILQAHNLVWVPTYWLAGLAQATATGSMAWAGLGVAGMAVWCVVPIVLLRHSARWYTVSLGRSNLRSRRARGARLARLLTFGSRKPIHFLYGQLILAQSRGDWRFKAQLWAVPVLFAVMVVSMASGLELGKLFANPFGHESLFHPAMIIIIAVGIPPILSLPMISQSADYRASWILKAGIYPETMFKRVSRRYVRLIFSFPFLGLLGAGYLLNGLPLSQTAAHVLMLLLITETMVTIVQTQLPGYPFSRPPQDEEMSVNMVVIMLMYEIQCVILAMVVYHVLYRWWWAYVAGIVAFGVIALARDLGGEKVVSAA